MSKIRTETILGLSLLVVGFFFYGVIDGFLAFFSYRNDFTHLYLAGYLADRGGNFFDPHLMRRTASYLGFMSLNPFVYPPFFAWLLIPLSKVSSQTAWLVFSALSHLAFLASLSLLHKLLCPKKERSLLWWGILLCGSALFYPLFRTFSAGQMNTFLLLCLVSTVYAAMNNRDGWAGILLGLGAAVKVSPAFLLLYFAWKGRWKACIAGGLTIAASVAVSLASLGVDVHRDFLHEAAQMSYGSSTWSQFDQHYHVEPHNQAPSAVLYRLFTHNPSTQGIVDLPALAKTFSLLTAIAILAWLLLHTRRFDGGFSWYEFNFWIAGMLLLPSLCWDHYFVQALPLLFYALARMLHDPVGDHNTLVVTISFMIVDMALWLGAWMIHPSCLTARYVVLAAAVLYYPYMWISRPAARKKVLCLVGFLLMSIPFLYDIPFMKSGWLTLGMALKLWGFLLIMAYIRQNPVLPENSFHG